ncbi:hypothetical protein JCGZ_20036 [Jatropha curcas]|uniref:WPP domain-associated protein n=1 Tax=Jatropha curcas TaxID=180498 RepID=A0A067L7D0_JATCU|nr:hypothetical protein JCGZ_20036 [Jatropha curcas]
MDELVGRVGGRFKISLTDSTMMRIVHSTMDKAHERAQSKEGVIERLTEISKFYELAVMQLEGCLSFVQEEADSSSEISNEEVLWDLTDIRDRLIGRLKELELAIAEKDRELTKRIENELKFRQALEMKERDLDSLCAKIKLEPTKIESVEALSLGNKGVEIKCLNDDLEALCLSQSNHEGKIYLGPRERSLSEEDIHGKPQNSTLRVEKVYQQKEVEEENTEDDAVTFVAKMIKNHESFIKKKSREAQKIKRENTGEKGCSSPKREEDLIKPRRKIQDVIIRMENLINWNAKLGESFGEYEGTDHEKSYFTRQEKSQIDHSEDGQEKVKTISMSNAVNELQNEIKILKEEKEDASLQMMILEKTYAALFEGFINESSNYIYSYDLEILIRESMHEDLLEKVVNEWNEQIESDQLGVQIREDINYIVFSEAAKDFGSTLDSALAEYVDARDERSCLEDYNIEGKLREEISSVFFGETCKEWNEFIERSGIENLIKEDIYQIGLEETHRDIANTTDHIICTFKEGILEGKLIEEISGLLFVELWKEWNEVVERSVTESHVREEMHEIQIEDLRDTANIDNCFASKLNEVKNLENCICFFNCNESFQAIEHSAKDDVCMVFLREMFKDWKKEIDAQNFECLIGEEIFLLAIVETMKEAGASYREAAAQDHFKTSEGFISDDKLDRSQEVSGEDILVQKQDSLLTCIKFEEDLIQSISSEIMQYDAHYHSIQKKHENLDKLKISQALFTEMGGTLSSVSSKVEKALEQIALSKALLDELRTCVGVTGEGIERVDDWTAFSDAKRPSLSQPKESKEVKVISHYSAFKPIMEFLQVFADFKCRVEKKLELHTLRLEEAMDYLNPLAELVARQRRKQWL